MIPVKTSQGSYDIVLQRGCLAKAGEYLNLNRKVLIVTDSGVPQVYAETLASCCKRRISISSSSKSPSGFGCAMAFGGGEAWGDCTLCHTRCTISRSN